MNSSGDVCILSVNIDNNLHVFAIKTNFLRGESNFIADLSSDGLEVELVFAD
jgi:hypothetical protein